MLRRGAGDDNLMWPVRIIYILPIWATLELDPNSQRDNSRGHGEPLFGKVSKGETQSISLRKACLTSNPPRPS